jgi:prepilin signal peptidase PulO-like enzyme (type II secretory pathway)
MENEVGKYPVHISWAYVIICKGYFKSSKQYDKNFIRPNCRKCQKILRIGDYVDGQYPWNSDNNRCFNCKKKEGNKWSD